MRNLRATTAGKIRQIGRLITARVLTVRRRASRGVYIVRVVGRARTIQVLRRLDRSALNSTSVLLLMVAVLTSCLAFVARPSTTYPSAVAIDGTDAIVLRVRSDHYTRPALRVTQKLFTERVGRDECWTGIQVGFTGDALIDGGSWQAEINAPPGSRIQTGAPERYLDELRPVPGVDLQVTEEARNPRYSLDYPLTTYRVLASVMPSVWSGEPVSVDLNWSDLIDSRPRDCAGLQDWVVSERGPNLDLKAPELRVFQSPAPVLPTLPLAVDAAVEWDGSEDYKIVTGPEPAPDARESDYRQNLDWSREAFAEDDQVLLDGTRRYGLKLPSVTAQSSSRQAVENRNVYIGGVLLGLAGAGLVGGLQEILNARRQRVLGSAPVRRLEQFFFEDRAPQLLLGTPRVAGEASGRVTRAIGALIAALSLMILVVTLFDPRASADGGESLLLTVVTFVHLVLAAFLLLLWRTAALGVAGFARQIVRVAGVACGTSFLLSFLNLLAEGSGRSMSFGDEVLFAAAPIAVFAFAAALAVACIKVALVHRWGAVARRIMTGASLVATTIAGTFLASILEAYDLVELMTVPVLLATFTVTLLLGALLSFRPQEVTLDHRC